MQLKWQSLGSSFAWLRPLVQSFDPHDVYCIWKKGQRIWVDSSLMGLRTRTRFMIPHWRRGHFSLLFDSTGLTAFVNRDRGTFVDVSR